MKNSANRKLKISKTWTVVLAVAALLFLSGCRKESQQEQQASPSAPVQPVNVVPVRAETLLETVDGIGTFQAPLQVEIRPELAALVTEVNFEEGETVEKDQILFVLDDRKLKQEEAARQAALQVAKVRLADAERRYERFDALLESRAVSKDERDAVKTAYEMAEAEVTQVQAELEQVQERLEDTVIRSPMSGIVSERHVDVGDFVSVGDQLLTIYQAKPLEVAFRVPERYMGRVKSGQVANVVVDAYPDQIFTGRVIFVSPSVNVETRNFLVKAAVDNEDELLKPGMFATVDVVVNEYQDRPVVPERALVATRSGYLVYVVEDGVARRREIQIGMRKPGIVEVSEGVEVGEQVISAGHMAVSDGAPVRVEE